MTITPEMILQLLSEIEQGDPLDFGDVPLSEADTRRLVALSMAHFSESLVREGQDSTAREALALATASRLLLDNLLLNYRLLKLSGSSDVCVSSLLSKLSKS